MQWAKKQTGFTIVELLIVVVVIAILAAITVVSYNGIMGNTHDSAVKSDLRSLVNQAMQYQAENGSYPAGTGGAAPTGLSNIHIATGSYDMSMNNFYYCRGSTSAGLDKVAVIAQSKSGHRFVYESDKGLSDYTGPWANSYSQSCGSLGVSSNLSYSLGYNNSESDWRAWVK